MSQVPEGVLLARQIVTGFFAADGDQVGIDKDTDAKNLSAEQMDSLLRLPVTQVMYELRKGWENESPDPGFVMDLVMGLVESYRAILEVAETRLSLGHGIEIDFSEVWQATVIQMAVWDEDDYPDKEEEE